MNSAKLNINLFDIKFVEQYLFIIILKFNFNPGVFKDAYLRISLQKM